MKVTIKNYNFFVHPYSPQGLMLNVSAVNCFYIGRFLVSMILTKNINTLLSYTITSIKAGINGETGEYKG